MTTSAPKTNANNNSSQRNTNNTTNSTSNNNSSSGGNPTTIVASASNNGIHATGLPIPEQPTTPPPPAAANSATVAGAAPPNGATRAMQSDEDFNIRFVNLVRIHKCLYDKKVPEYRNRDNQEKAWSLISHETRESVIHCKERWRNLRACLSRYIKQQSGADPQHKPYYLTEHMAFLLPFLKSTRHSYEQSNPMHQNGNSLTTTIFQLSQPSHVAAFLPGQFHLGGEQTPPASLPQEHMEMKRSLSEQDEETIDAFDPAVTASLRTMDAQSPQLSDTASANTMQNFIPDVQLAELRLPEGSEALGFGGPHNCRLSSHDFASEPKRFKTECPAGDTTVPTPTPTAPLQLYAGENADMEFFRSILPDIAGLTPQQKRKFKIGILELIDDVLEKFPSERHPSVATGASCSREATGEPPTSQHRTVGRDWRK